VASCGSWPVCALAVLKAGAGRVLASVKSRWLDFTRLRACWASQLSKDAPLETIRLVAIAAGARGLIDAGDPARWSTQLVLANSFSAPRPRARPKQAFAGTQDQREGQQPEFVDQIVRQQGLQQWDS